MIVDEVQYLHARPSKAYRKIPRTWIPPSTGQRYYICMGRRWFTPRWPTKLVCKESSSCSWRGTWRQRSRINDGVNRCRYVGSKGKAQDGLSRSDSTVEEITFMRLRKVPPTIPLFLFGGSRTTTVRSTLWYVTMKHRPTFSGMSVLRQTHGK